MESTVAARTGEWMLEDSIGLSGITRGLFAMTFFRGAFGPWTLSFIGWAVYGVAIGAPAHVLAWTLPALDVDEG